ncbi:hypothetical protein CBM2589_B10033 [Cupriavidus taiwanensis]|uniref:Uncharacterized protein n=1 Tax=Cupriavidus taiwanensis TaxID=164546 RepID=A0A375B7V3_9BURK|nr:hypothetical protein CBM2589_B10033 [Cupriavidus taiwanensis]
MTTWLAFEPLPSGLVALATRNVEPITHPILRVAWLLEDGGDVHASWGQH